MNTFFNVMKKSNVLLVCIVGIGVLIFLSQNNASAEPPFNPLFKGLCELYEALGIEPEDPALCPSEQHDRIIFLTKGTYKAQDDFIGVRGADMACQREAREAGFPGKFIAWLSDGSKETSPILRLRGSSGFVRPDGARVADNLNDLLTNGPDVPINVHPDETTCTDTVQCFVYTNIADNGEVVQSPVINNCWEWTSHHEEYRGAIGRAYSADPGWSWLGDYSDCGFRKYLYCVQEAD